MEQCPQQCLRPVLYRRSADEVHMRIGIFLNTDKKGRQYVMSIDTLGIEELPAAITLTGVDWDAEVCQLLQRIAFTNDGRPRRWKETIARGTDSLGRDCWTGCGAGPVPSQIFAAMLADLRRVYQLGLRPINFVPAGPDGSKLWQAVCEYLHITPQMLLDILSPHVPREVLAAEVAAGFTLTPQSSQRYLFPVRTHQIHTVPGRQHSAQPEWFRTAGTDEDLVINRSIAHHLGSTNNVSSKPSAVEHPSGQGSSQAPGDTALQSQVPQQQRQDQLRLASLQHAASYRLGQLVQGHNVVEHQPGQQVLAVPVHYQQQQAAVPLGAPWTALLTPATALQPLLACTGNLDLRQLASQLPFTCLPQQHAVTTQPPAVALNPPHLPAAAIGQRAPPAAAACRAMSSVLQLTAAPIAAAVQPAAIPAFAAAPGQAAACAARSSTSLAEVMSQGDVIAISCLDAEDQPLGHVKLRIDTFLGQGGNGVAFLATVQQSSSSTIHEALETHLQVVIKVPLLLLRQVASSEQPPPDTAATAAEYTYAKKEYAVMQEVKACPHIVICYAHGRLQHCSKPYIQLPVIVLEYCNLGSWGDLLFPGGCSSSAVIKQDAWTVHHAMKGLLAAILFLTDCNILHSDVKPDNVFFKGTSLGSCRVGAHEATSYGSLDEAFPFQIKLADFGCARFKPGGMARTRNIGTRAFHAPEMGSRDSTNYGSLADSYAAGLCLLVGRCGIKCPFNYMGKRFADLSYAEARQVAMERCQQLPVMYGKSFCANEIEFATGSLEADPAERWTPYMMARSAYIRLGPNC